VIGKALTLKDGEDSVVLLHPNMAGYYRDQVAQLREALSGNGQAEAIDLIRKLIDRIVLTPVEDEKGRKTLSIDLHGHLAGILSLATKAKKPLGESGFAVESVKLVAGTRNQRYLQLLMARIPCVGQLVAGIGFDRSA
jgi:hypothetical protein